MSSDPILSKCEAALTKIDTILLSLEKETENGPGEK